jgi:hypothetical protein
LLFKKGIAIYFEKELEGSFSMVFDSYMAVLVSVG